MFRGMNCRKCTYFDNKKKSTFNTFVILGYCNIREKFVTDESINNELCKDKAVVEPNRVEEMKKKKQELAEKFKNKEQYGKFVTF